MPDTAEERSMCTSSSSPQHYDERRFHLSAVGAGMGRQMVHGEPMHDVVSPQGLPLKGALWNKDTDLVLRDLVLRSAIIDWVKIASTIEWDTGKNSAEECQRRYVCMYVCV